MPGRDVLHVLLTARSLVRGSYLHYPDPPSLERSVVLPPVTTNGSLRLYLGSGGCGRLYTPRPFPFLSRGVSLPSIPSLPPPLIPSWPAFPLSGRKRRHRTIFTEGQLREVSSDCQILDLSLTSSWSPPSKLPTTLTWSRGSSWPRGST